MHNGEEIVRERALRLVHTKLKTNTSDLLNKEAQAQVITEVCFLDLIYKISPAVDCGDQEGFRLRHRHWRRVPETDGDPQHDLLAQVHRRSIAQHEVLELRLGGLHFAGQVNAI